MIKPFDRIKEFSINPGTGPFELEGPAYGYRSFSSVYASGDICYYAAVCDNVYEIGSGVYSFDGISHSLSRNVIVSTNSGQLVDFPNLTKEVFVTYPANFSVYTENAVNSGELAVWKNQNTIDSSSISWNGDTLNIPGQVGISGGVVLPPAIPTDTQNKLYNFNGALFFNGQSVDSNLLFSYVNVTGDYSISLSDKIIFADASVQDIAITLPTASGVGGKQLLFKRKPGNNQISINPASGEYIDGQTTFTMHYNYDSISLISDNINWYVF